MHKQTEITKRLVALLHQIIPYLTPEQQPLPVVIVSSQISSTIDYRELHVGKLIGSGEFA
ncbi:unnamed protein product, partial [Adineta steineri]